MNKNEHRILQNGVTTTRKERIIGSLKCAALGFGFFLLLLIEWWYLC